MAGWIKTTMPIEKIPVVHKFGIISKCFQEEYLQEKQKEISSDSSCQNKSMTQGLPNSG